MIPKKIHYCWFGRNPLPEEFQQYLLSWEKYCPDYEIIRWDETNFPIEECNDYVKEAASKDKWAFISDYARLKIIYEEGGIYLDTDVELLKPLDDLLNNYSFFGFEPPFYQINTGVGFGSESKNPLLKEILNIYDNIHFIKEDGSLNQTTCVQHTNNILTKLGLKNENRIQVINNNTFYPTDYFCPINWIDGTVRTTDNTYSIHHYSYSWASKEDKKIHNIEQKCIRLFGNKLGSLIGLIYRKAYKGCLLMIRIMKRQI